MEGSNISVRSSGWKNSITRKGPGQSRLNQSKDFPVKFSPSKNTELNGKLIAKSNILSFSHDEITLGGEAHKSVGKDSKLFKRPTIQTPTSRDMAADSRRSFKTIPSEKLFEGASSPRKSKAVDRNDKGDMNSMECLYEIKLEYTRFKHTVMKELKKMQSDIKTAIEEVMAAFQKVQPGGGVGHIPRVSRANSFEIASPTFPSSPVFDSEVNFTKTLPKLHPSKSINVQTTKFHDVLADNSALQSVLPKINERMSKFFDLMGQLKTEINEQAMYSPVGTKTGQFGQ